MILMNICLYALDSHIAALVFLVLQLVCLILQLVEMRRYL
uniref:Uncharacterized protein n=1 Tax=Klebsiella phage FKP3 TaxID=3231233 RepID=A0AAU8HZ28_9CAUD